MHVSASELCFLFWFCSFLKQKGGRSRENTTKPIVKSIVCDEILCKCEKTYISYVKEPTLVMAKSLVNGQRKRPHQLITWGRGSACVFTDQGQQWLPARNVKPVLSS